MESEEKKDKTLIAFIEQTAQLLRSQLGSSEKKGKKWKNMKVVSPASFSNTVEQIAKLLRSQVHAKKPAKKRTWKKKNKD